MSALHVGVLVLGLVVSSADGGARKLNGPLPRAPGGDVMDMRYTPDGTRFVFRADRERDDVFELYSVPASGGTPVKLNGPLGPDDDVRSGLRITPDSARVLFLSGIGPGRLFSVPVDGSAPAVEVATGLYSISATRVSHDGAWVLFGQGGGVMARPIDASAPAFPLVPSGGSYFEVSPTANQVVYVTFPDLFTVDIAPGAVPVQLSPPMSNGDHVSSWGDSGVFEISRDGTTVVYLVYRQTDDVVELLSVPIGGGTAVSLSGGIVTFSGGPAYVFDFDIDPTSSRAVFGAGDFSTTALYSAPLDGSGAPVELEPSVADWDIDPTGQHVVFSKANPYTYKDVWSSAIDGSSPAVELAIEIQDFTINSQGTRVALRFTDRYTGISQIISTPIDGHAQDWTMTSLNNGFLTFDFTPDGATLLFQSDLDVPGTVDFFSKPAGGGTAIQLNEPLPDGGQVRGFHSHPTNGTVAIVADLSTASVFEAFSVPLSGGANTRLSGAMANTNLLGSVSAFRTADKRAVYVAHPGDPARAQLFGVSFGGEARALSLGGSQHVDPQGLVLTPDGKRVLYLTTNTSATGEVELFSAPSDASSPPVRIGRDMQADGALLPFQLAPGKLVVFLSDRRTEDVRELFAGPIDGSFPAVRLSGALVAGGDVVDFSTVPCGSGIVYRADQASDEVFELWCRNLTAAQVRLNGPLVTGGDVVSYLVSPDGTFVVYLADQSADDVFELFRVPLDGSSPPVRLNSALVSGGDVLEFRFSPEGSRIVYLADQLVNGKDELFSVRSDASAGPVKISHSLPAGIDVLPDFQMRPGNPRVVYRDFNALFAAPIDGSTPAFQISPFGGYGSYTPFDLTPDGSRAIFRYLLEGLWSVPTDASAPPVRIDDIVDGQGSLVHAFHASPAGDQVAYVAEPYSKGITDLYLAPIDGSGTPRRLNRPHSALGDIAPDFAFTPDGTGVLFRAEDQDPDAFELYLSVIDGHVRGAGEPGD